jgi:hypothetical protein
MNFWTVAYACFIVMLPAIAVSYVDFFIELEASVKISPVDYQAFLLRCTVQTFLVPNPFALQKFSVK